MSEWAIPIFGAVFVLATFALNAYGMRQKADESHVSALDRRMEQAEGRLRDCIEARGIALARIEALEGENNRLMRRLLLNGGEKKS